MQYDFDTVIDRKPFSSEKWHVKQNELPMWIADMDFKTAPEVIKAIQKRAEHGIFGYSRITDDFFEAVQYWWKKRYNFSVKKEEIIFSTGVIPSISTAVRKFTTPAEKIVILTPVYNIFFNSILNNGRKVLECPLEYKNETYEINFSRLEECLSDPNTTMLIFCNPHNPCGKIWSKKELAVIGKLCQKHGVTVLSDEIHCDLTKPGKKYIPFASVNDVNKNITITCVAPSKTFNLAGLQASAVIIQNEHLKNRMNRALNTDEVAEPNAFAIQASVAAWKNGEDWLECLRKYLWQNREEATLFIKEKIPLLKTIQAEATYLLWIDCSNFSGLNKKIKNATELAQNLRNETGLILSAGELYGTGGEQFLRMNLACPRTILQDGLNRLERFFTKDILENA